MKRIFIAVLCILMMQLFCQYSQAGQLADRKLIEILKREGILTDEEAESVIEILKKEEVSGKDSEGVEITYDDGFKIQTKDKKTASLKFGGRVQADLKIYGSHYPVDNDFDIRRARLYVEGRIYEYFKYKLEQDLFETKFYIVVQ